MKKHGFYLVTVALTFLISATAFAKGNGKFANLSEEEKLERMETRLDKRVERMTEKLGLNAKQVAQVRQILSEGQTQTFELRENAADKKAVKAEVKAVRQATKAKIEAILDADQIETFKTMKKGKKGKKGKHLKKALKQLDLDDDQKVAVKAIMKDTKTQLKALKAQGLEKDERRAKGKLIKQASAAKIEAELNPTQLAKFQEIRAEHKARRGKRKGKHNETKSL